MKTSPWRSALPILAAFVVGACSSDAEDVPEASSITTDVPPVMGGAAPLSPQDQQRQMELMGELQAIDQQLGLVRDQAMGDASMVTQQEELVATIEAAMEERRRVAGSAAPSSTA